MDIGPDRSTLEQLLEVSPEAAAIQAFLDLEEVMRTLLAEVGLLAPRQARQSMRFLTKIAQDASLIDAPIANTIHEITGLRNLMLHKGLPESQQHLDRKRAEEYIEVTEEMRTVISRIPRGRAYESAVQSALKRLDVPCRKTSLQSDSGFDFVVGEADALLVEVKYSGRAMDSSTVHQVLGSPRDRPVLIVSNSRLTQAGLRALDSTGDEPKVIFVRWLGPQDDEDLVQAVFAAMSN